MHDGRPRAQAAPGASAEVSSSAAELVALVLASLPAAMPGTEAMLGTAAGDAPPAHAAATARRVAPSAAGSRSRQAVSRRVRRRRMRQLAAAARSRAEASHTEDLTEVAREDGAAASAPGVLDAAGSSRGAVRDERHPRPPLSRGASEWLGLGLGLRLG